MREKLAGAARVFLTAYIGAAGWVLAGCGWGIVVGSALQAVFGRGTHGLLDTAGETSLEATAGALAGMAGGVLLITGCFVCALTLVAAILDRLEGLTPGGKRCRALGGWRSTPLGALVGLACGVCLGPSLGATVGAGAVITSFHGTPIPCPWVQGIGCLGVLVGGIVGAAGLWRSIYRQLPERWREEIRPRR
jgi:hypothetical protein